MSDSYAEHMVRNATEAQRLDQQFDLFTENLGYVIHPFIAKGLAPTARIADVGTGTGAFLRRLATHYPSAVLDGYDISPALFPEKSALASNVNFSVLDVRQPVPDELRRTYDLVHVRLIAVGMPPSEWRSVVQNLSQLLRPGGALQWEECAFVHTQHLRGRLDSTVAAARFMGSLFGSGLRERFEHGWNSLPEDMAAAGLTSVGKDLVSSDRVPETREAFTANGMVAIFQWARLLSSKQAPGALSSERLQELEREAYADIKSGCYARFDIHVAWGFLPEV